MRRPRVLPILVLCACVALGWQIGGADRFDRNSFEAAEAIRLRAHFADVETELLARDLSSLTARQRSARAEQIRRLRSYAAAGKFPRNDFHEDRRVPYFRDARGNLCAMAFLLAASGRGDLVDRIARTRNYAYVIELADQPGLTEWLEEHGLTLAEAARIQPSYDGIPCCGVITPDTKPSTGYWVASAGATGLAGFTIAMNTRSAERLSRGAFLGAMGMGVGAVTMALGAAKIGDEGWKNQTLGAWNVAVGATAAILGIRALNRRKSAAAATASRLSVTPTTLAGNRPAIGFLGQFRF